MGHDIVLPFPYYMFKATTVGAVADSTFVMSFMRVDTVSSKIIKDKRKDDDEEFCWE